MKTLRIIPLLLFLLLVSLTVHSTVLESQKKIIFKTTESWGGKADKSVLFTSIDAYVVDNNCIKAQFFGKGDTPSTFQIKDSHGYLIYQDVLYLSGEDTYRIDISGFNPGKYSLIYYDEYMEAVGEFEKE